MTGEAVAITEDKMLTALVVIGGDDGVCTVRKVEAVTEQGVSAQDSTVTAFVVAEGIVLVLGGVERAAAEHSLEPGGQE